MQNATAGLIYLEHLLGHITDALVNLHWLRVSECVVSKIAMRACKVLHRQAPRTNHSRRRLARSTCT